MHGLDRYKHLKPFPHFGVVLYIIFPGDFIIVWFNSHISRQWHSRDSINYRRYHPTLNTRGGVKNLYLAIKIPRHWTKLRTYILQDEENKGFIKILKDLDWQELICYKVGIDRISDWILCFVTGQTYGLQDILVSGRIIVPESGQITISASGFLWNRCSALYKDRISVQFDIRFMHSL